MLNGWKKDQVYAQLKQRILNGEYPPGMRLPRELEFSRELNVAKVTLRSALSRLDAEGLIKRLPSKGTFVAKSSPGDLILVVIPQESDFQHPHHYIVPGITAAAAGSGRQVELCFVEYLRELGPEKSLDYLKQKNISGTLLLNSTYNGDEIELEIFHRLGRPVLLVHADMNDHVVTGFSSLVADGRQAWRSGLAYLAEQGFENVRILERSNVSRGWDSEEYVPLFKELGLNPHGRISYQGEMKQNTVDAALRSLLKDHPGVEAIFCYSDFYAIRAVKFLQSENIRVPDDIAVMGYCGYPGNVMLDPPLSTVDLDYMNVGRMAVELLPQSPEGRVIRHFSNFRVIGRKSSEKCFDAVHH